MAGNTQASLASSSSHSESPNLPKDGNPAPGPLPSALPCPRNSIFGAGESLPQAAPYSTSLHGTVCQTPKVKSGAGAPPDLHLSRTHPAPSCSPHLPLQPFLPAAPGAGPCLAKRETCTALQSLLLLFPHPNFLLSAIRRQVVQVSLTGPHRGPDGAALTPSCEECQHCRSRLAPSEAEPEYALGQETQRQAEVGETHRAVRACDW